MSTEINKINKSNNLENVSFLNKKQRLNRYIIIIILYIIITFYYNL